MDVSGHQQDFILLHIWQEIPPAPTPTVSSTDLPHNARVGPKYLKERAPAFLAWSFFFFRGGGVDLLPRDCRRRSWLNPPPKHHSVVNAYLFPWMMSARLEINGGWMGELCAAARPWMWPSGGDPIMCGPHPVFCHREPECHCLLEYCCRMHLHASLWGVFKSTVKHAHQCCWSRGDSVECWLPPFLLCVFFFKGSKRLKLRCVQVVFKNCSCPPLNLTSCLPKKENIFSLHVCVIKNSDFVVNI